MYFLTLYALRVTLQFVISYECTTIRCLIVVLSNHVQTLPTFIIELRNDQVSLSSFQSAQEPTKK